jgi:hypothetical protein
MANRHKHHAKGGGVSPKHDDEKEEYNAQGSHVMEEAHEKKRGGKVKRKEGGKVPGFKSGGRLDKFARGGRAGGDMLTSPFSSAHISGHKRGGAPRPHKGK